MIVSKYIKTLLQHNDCVIVPNFGGFLRKRVPAQFVQTNSIRSPRTEIVFHPQMQSNDGLLLQNLIVGEQISEHKANALVDEFVNKASQHLINTGSFTVEGVGRLTANNNEFQFKEFATKDFNEKRFGLPSIQVEAINRFKQSQQSVQQIQKKLSPAAAIFTVAATFLALLLAGSLYLLNNGTVQEQELLRSDILSSLSFDFKPNKAETKATITKEINAETTTDEIHLEGEPVVNEVEQPAEVAPVVEADETEEMNEAEPIEQFHVVVGMFTREENAQTVQDEAATKGYSAKILKGRKYYRVVVPFTTQQATWVQAQRQLSKDVAADAWIWETRFK